jgi:protein ImuB
MMVTAANTVAEQAGVLVGNVLADAKAICPALCALQDDAIFFEHNLKDMAQWFLRYAPVIAVHPPDCIIIEATGCTHLWGGEANYLKHIQQQLNGMGYTIKLAMAGSIGAAWAVAHYDVSPAIVQPGMEAEALASFPPAALRLESQALELLQKLGMVQIRDFMHLPAAALRRRFGTHLIKQIQYAIGSINEPFEAISPKPEWQERLVALSPIVNEKGIAIALQQLLEAICNRLKKNGLGLRKVICTCYKTDRAKQAIEITVRNTCNNAAYLHKLFSYKIASLRPEPGIEQFCVTAMDTGICEPLQEALWVNTGISESAAVSALLDSMAIRIGAENITRFFPAAHYWPERAILPIKAGDDRPGLQWVKEHSRPILLLENPISIQVTAPVPDYPPMLFRHQQQVYKIIRADGPERIEQEWWLQQGHHRDYYHVEVENGNRYWIFRLGHYDAEKKDQWFLHGYCA